MNITIIVGPDGKTKVETHGFDGQSCVNASKFIEQATIERLGFELHVPTFEPDRKEAKRQRRLRLWRQSRRDRNLAEIAHKVVQS